MHLILALAIMWAFYASPRVCVFSVILDVTALYSNKDNIVLLLRGSQEKKTDFALHLKLHVSCIKYVIIWIKSILKGTTN